MAWLGEAGYSGGRGRHTLTAKRSYGGRLLLPLPLLLLLLPALRAAAGAEPGRFEWHPLESHAEGVVASITACGDRGRVGEGRVSV